LKKKIARLLKPNLLLLQGPKEEVITKIGDKVRAKVGAIVGDLADAMAKERITTTIVERVAGKLKEMQAENGGAELKPAIVKKKLHEILEAKIKSKLADIAENIEGLDGDAEAKEAAIKKAIAPKLKAKIGDAVDDLAGKDLTDAVKTKLKERIGENLNQKVGGALKKIVASGLAGDALKAKLKEELPEKLKKVIARQLKGADLLLLQGQEGRRRKRR